MELGKESGLVPLRTVVVTIITTVWCYFCFIGGGGGWSSPRWLPGLA